MQRARRFVARPLTRRALTRSGLILTIGAGAAFAGALGVGWGVLVGTLAVWVGSNVGAGICMLLGRYLLRDWVNELVQKCETTRDMIVNTEPVC